MLRERISEGIYIFTSDLYAQVTAGVIVTSKEAMVVDTLPFPQETRELLAFVQALWTLYLLLNLRGVLFL